MEHLLKKYRAMRDFGATPEPSGGKPKRSNLPIFVIQKHQASHLHYDFRLEMEGVLKSWAIPKGPSYDPAVKRLAMMTEDHPYDYASFEGVIPAGQYGGGNVIIWDNGTWELIEPEEDPVKGIRAGKLTFRMSGRKMFGEWALVRIHGRAGSKGNEWLLLKHRDEFANDDIDVTEVAPRSIISDLTVEQIGGSNRIWQSNRSASGAKEHTLASRLESEKAATKTRKKAPAKAPEKKATEKRAPVPRPGRSVSAQKKAPSSPTRSSTVRSPRKAAPTPRRRPR